MNFLRQNCRKLSFDRQTCKHTDKQAELIDRNNKPRRLADGQESEQKNMDV